MFRTALLHEQSEQRWGAAGEERAGGGLGSPSSGGGQDRRVDKDQMDKEQGVAWKAHVLFRISPIQHCVFSPGDLGFRDLKTR